MTSKLLQQYLYAALAMAVLTALDGFFHLQGWFNQERVAFSILEMLWFMASCMLVFYFSMKNRPLAISPLLYVIYVTVSITVGQLLLPENMDENQLYLMPPEFGLLSMLFALIYFYINMKVLGKTAAGES